MALLVATGLVLASLVGAVALYSGLLPRPNPSPFMPRRDLILVRSSGPFGDGIATGEIIAVDVASGEIATLPDLQRPTRDGIVYSDQSAFDVAPDGATLAISSEGRILIVGSDGTTRDRGPCGSTGVYCDDLDWSPDGGTLAVVTGGQLWLVDVYTGSRTRLVDAGSFVSGVSWAPDGDRLAIHAAWIVDGVVESRIQVINRDGSGLTRIATDEVPGGSVSWSPDGTRVAYLAGGDVDHEYQGLSRSRITLNVVSVSEVARAGQPQVVADLGTCFCMAAPDLAWSPDSTQLVVLKPDRPPEPDPVAPGLYLVEADGSNLRLLAGGVWGPVVWRPATDTGPAPALPVPPPGPVVVGASGGLAVGVDPITGERVELGVFPLPEGYGPEGVYTEHSDGTASSHSSGGEYALSPDGSRSAFIGRGLAPNQRPGLSQLTFLVYVGGPHREDPSKVLDLGTCYCMAYTGIAWSPDGTWLAVTKPDRVEGADAGLYIARADGSGLQLILPGTWGRPIWLEPGAVNPSSAP